ncbi:DUF1097 domain-containing protein [Vibrio comitans]|uniref:DUF1097 domain-containing protein n=1 Tax=Vibrio comitans NBRC 102076 TaxID=1219078 RepID=A0A4Y3IRV4_9VIBR|nr:DUF1097 domain-containing protein [Vibrio comitans]GEA61614.1 hypothetical protein VCO01S_28070 [Vibrio comitans NBRC 102076]
MKFSQFIFIPVIVAFLAFTIQIVDQLFSPMMPVAGNVGFGWIAFIAWAMYFMAGCNIDGGIKTFCGYLSGIVASIAIMELGGAFIALGFFAFPVAIFFVVIPCICLERFPPFDFVPALFVGAGTFFGFMSYVSGATYLTATITELVYCLIGLGYGWVTVALRTRYEQHVEDQVKEGEHLPH